MKKTLLIVGGSSDIGTCTIKDIHEHYHLVIAHYHHMNEKLEHLKREMGEKLICLQADLSDEIQTQHLIEEIEKKKIVPSHILHLPSAPIRLRKFHATDWHVFQQQMDISVRSAIMILSKFLPQMAKTGGGKVLIMLSMAVNHMPPKYSSDYVMSKYALFGLVKSLAVEYGDKKITVNGLSPSLIETRFVEGMHDYVIEQNAQASLMGRNLRVEDIIPTIKYLLSPGADCMNGQNILITSGR